MLIKNARIYGSDGTFAEGSLLIKGDRIRKLLYSGEKTTEVNPGEARECSRDRSGEEAPGTPESRDEDVIDAGGQYAIPGLVDLHFHGGAGADFCDGTQEAIRTVAEYEASVGVAAICPATMTLSVPELEHILAEGARFRDYQRSEEHPEQADLVGINMEGPFISKLKKGAQDEQNILPCSTDICRRFLKAADGLLKFVGIAPEDNPDFASFIAEMKGEVGISLAHTNADYDTAKAAFDAGASHAVHLFNAMPAFTHRQPGVVGAVSDSEQVDAEIICDGIHIHPSMVRAAFKMMGADRMILISDTNRAAGMGDGIISLGGLDVCVKGNLATLVSDGAIAGSVTNLFDCMKTAVKEMGIPLEIAVKCASFNPARCLGINDLYGSLEPGRKADVLLVDEDLNLKTVIKDGRKIR